MLKANVDRLQDIRRCDPSVPPATLRRLPRWFPAPGHIYPLDPTYEPDKRESGLDPHSEHEAIFKQLQRCASSKLVEPVGAEHMYFAAMQSEGCRLTPLGEHYRHLDRGSPVTTFGVTGHQRAPATVWENLRDELQRLFRGVRPLTGVSSLAAGADQRFALTLLRSGGLLHVVIPSFDYESSFDNEADLHQFKSLMSRAAEVETLPFGQPSEDAYLAAGRRVVDLCDVLVAVWDGLPAQGKGGTADIASYARSLGKPVTTLWPTGVQR